MNDVDSFDADRLSGSIQENVSRLPQPIIDNNIKPKTQQMSSSKRMINKSKARIRMLDDTEEYIDLRVCRNV
jgi:hypothetical protein